MDAAQRAFFRANGYLVLRQAVDPAHIEALRALFEEHAIPEVRPAVSSHPAGAEGRGCDGSTRRAQGSRSCCRRAVAGS